MLIIQQFGLKVKCFFRLLVLSKRADFPPPNEFGGFQSVKRDEWHAEIHKLTEDELFVQRWLLLNDGPASLEKGKRAIAKIQKQRKAIEKKRNRFLWWYYPTIIVIGTGIGMLTHWLQKD